MPVDSVDLFYNCANVRRLGYFAVCTGLVIILSSVFWILCSDHTTGASLPRYISTAVTMLVGLGIALLSILTVTSAAENLGETAWSLPALMLIMLGRTSLLNLPYCSANAHIVQ